MRVMQQSFFSGLREIELQFTLVGSGLYGPHTIEHSEQAKYRRFRCFPQGFPQHFLVALT
jgi:hypothetical protein